ncbi:MAG: FecR protein [Gemmatimonadetes bacterium]|nr:FecR protein [Gemmatimonadota bacterium]
MNDVDWDLLFRYLGKECTADERTRVEAWLAADERHRGILDAAMQAADNVLARVPVASDIPRIVVSHGIRQRTPHRNSGRAFAAAASLLLAVGGVLVWRTLGPMKAPGAPVSIEQVATTGRGQRDTVRLQDGTRVVLGAASTLRYPAAFSGRTRDVYLTGEGYFDVVHDSAHPFRVHAGDATAEDVGTAFGVRAFAGDSLVQVVVAEGAVAFGAATSAEKGAVLTQGQLGRLAKGRTVAHVERVNVDAYLGWVKGRLVFDETPLDEVAAQLERWYGVDVRIADTAHASQRLTASFANESLPDVLAVIAQTFDFRVEQRGDAIVMRPRERGR